MEILGNDRNGVAANECKARICAGRNFSAEALETMRTASRHISYLINEGYDLKQASGFVGNHFMLSERQRLAIMRSLATDSQLNLRRQKQVGLAEISGKEVWIDGFNIIITLEVLLAILSFCHAWMARFAIWLHFAEPIV